MLWSFHDAADLFFGSPLAQAREALAHGRQLDLLVGLPCFCTDVLYGVVGQQQMGQATDVQVIDDLVGLQHLIIAQAQVLGQFLEQHLNEPAAFVDLHDLPGFEFGFVGDDGNALFPRPAGTLADDHSHLPDVAQVPVAGKLVLVLSKVTVASVDLSSILYSLPTITCDGLPPIASGTSKLGADVIEIHEDDWRQIEWLPASAAPVIETELVSVRRIYQEGRQGQGFAKCQVRAAIPTISRDQKIRLSELRTAIGVNASWLAGFGYQGVAGIVTNSFAVRLLSSIELFGVAPGGIIESVCFANTRANNVVDPAIQNLARFAGVHRLLLVDWCRIVALPPSPTEYAAHFAGE
jgi:hypothetical protein